MVKNTPVNAGDMGSISPLRRSPGEGNGNLLLPGKSHGQRRLVGTVHGAQKRQTGLSN